MNCQEVMELMQRQLDGDLEAHEQDELHAHLAYCLDCAQMFERLQRLSDELTQLPKVVPPYSLVDAIMPQISELDKLAAASITDKVAVFSTNASQMDHGQTSKLPRTRRVGSQFSWKFAGGIVAAGLILGFFAFNMQHPVIDNADGLLPARSSAESKSSEQAAGADRKSVTTDSVIENKDANPTDVVPVPSSQALTDTMEKSDNKQAPAASGAGVTGPQATTDAKLEKPQPITQDTNRSTNQMKVAPSTSEPARMQDPAQSSVGEKKDTETSLTNQSTLGGAVNSPEKQVDPKEAASSKAGEQSPPPLAKKGADSSDAVGFQSLYAAPANELHSKTDVYVAVVEKQHVIIRSSKTLEVVFESKQIWKTDDPITLVEWSKDEILFYQVESGGSLHTSRIDLKNKTEVSP
ncbi:zf-HC2 domain-containing protein [Paenibacillus sp. HWE-109]|uniref:anti-sigma factor family protein n=1 Tax=Paenibacillus sp. HWE-109 TaxID=1306526 RepID=UPI001EDD4D52|nr:zf-HC2 domain-containing protein [Paenibacillus sp. HWE-109]UKS30394.1 zf-HC2 domain-containing protein [Paenibacillus sp. HWE-109]